MQQQEEVQKELWDDFLSSSVLALNIGDETNWNLGREKLTWGAFTPLVNSDISPSKSDFPKKWKQSLSDETDSIADESPSPVNQDIQEQLTRPPTTVDEQSTEMEYSRWPWSQSQPLVSNKTEQQQQQHQQGSSSCNKEEVSNLSSPQSSNPISIEIPLSSTYASRIASIPSDNGQPEIQNTGNNQFSWNGNRHDTFHQDTIMTSSLHSNYPMRMAPTSPLFQTNGNHYGISLSRGPAVGIHSHDLSFGDPGSCLTTGCVPTTRRSPTEIMYYPYASHRPPTIGRTRASSVIDTLDFSPSMYEHLGREIEMDYNIGTKHRARAQSDATLCCSRLMDEWAGFYLPEGNHKRFFYEVEFKRYRRNFFYSEKEFLAGTPVKVEADRGEDLGRILRIADDLNVLRSPTNKYGEGGPDKIHGILPKRVLRIASEVEMQQLARKTEEEVEVLEVCRSKVRQRLLPMKVIDAEYQFDRHKLTFFFEADRRIDFRELVRDLFAVYKTRIWLQQVTDGVKRDQL